MTFQGECIPMDDHFRFKLLLVLMNLFNEFPTVTKVNGEGDSNSVTIVTELLRHLFVHTQGLKWSE